jgi:hypothetical protein
MPGHTSQTMRQIVFATIVLAFLGATVGTAFGMVRTSRDDGSQSARQGSQPGVSPSVTTTPSGGTAEQVADQTNTGTNTGANTDAGTGQTERPNHCKVPKVITLKEDEARKKLTDCGLAKGDVKYTCDEQTEPGKVVWQSLEPGAWAERGTKVSIKVQGVTVPDVIGQYHGDAKGMLEHAGLKVTVNNNQPGASGGAVTAQSPAGHSCVKVGATVTITVGTATTPTPSNSATA